MRKIRFPAGKNAELWILKNDFQKVPVALGEICYEGPAVSRNNLRIAWSVRGDQPDAVFYMADLRYYEFSGWEFYLGGM